MLIISMVDKIKTQIMVRFYNKRKQAENWHGSICPKIRKIVEKNIELSATCMLSGAGDGIFQV